MKGIIPIGGRGTRMRPVTFSANKHFIPVANKLLIEYPIETVAAAGITEIAITYNPGQLDYAREILGDGNRWSVSLTYILQPEPKGLANIYEVCEEWTGGDSFVLHLGDNIFTSGIEKFVEYFEEKAQEGLHGLVAMLEHPENARMGVPYFDEEGRLQEYVEKPEDPPHNYAVPGVYFMDQNGFEVFKGDDKIQPSERGEYEITDAFQWLIDHGFQVDVLEYEGIWLDPGKFDDWLESNRYLLDQNAVENVRGQVDSESRIEGRVEVGRNSRIINSVVRGPVRIGENVTVENAFVGPYTSIYHNCMVKSCHIENSVLMQNVTLENIHRPIDTSLIGPDSKVSFDDSHNRIELFVGELSNITL